MIFLPTPGALVANRFRLRHPIGKGGMGQVWEAHDRELDSACAIKFILDHLARDPDARSRLVREARAVARLRSPHVVTILGVGEHADAIYLAMELLEGETLATRLERTRRLDGVTTLAIVEQVVQVLDKAHAHGIVHRDLKPDNIWLSADTPPFIKVLDFGVAKSTLKTGEKQTATGALMGTPHYMSPEQASGDREVDHRSDLWALAVIAMECLSGRRPFESGGLGDLLMKIMQSRPPPAQALDPSLPPAVNLWWQQALAHDLEQRFQTASELALGLRTALGITVAPVGASPFAETARGTWGLAPAPRTPTLVTNITPAPPSSPQPDPEPVPSTTAAPVPAAPQPAPSPAIALSSAPSPPVPPVAPATLSVESTQVAEAPPPFTEVTVPPAGAASFPFRGSEGSVGAVMHTARGKPGGVSWLRWPLLAAAGCALLALVSFTWWRLRQEPLSSAADIRAPAPPVLVQAPATSERTISQSLRPESASGAPTAAPPVIAPVAPAIPAEPTLPPVSGPAVSPVRQEPTVAPPVKEPTISPVLDTPPAGQGPAQSSAKPRAPSKPRRSPAASTPPPKKSAPPARRSPASDSSPSSSELQRRLGF